MLKKLIRLNAGDLLLFGGVNCGVFLVLQVVIACVMAFLSPCDSIMVSGTLLAFVSAILMFCGALSHVSLTFVQAVQFGQTRRRALGLTLGLVGAQSLFTLGVAALLSWLEWTAAPKLWQLLAGADGYAIAQNGRAMLESGDQSGTVLWIDTFLLDWWWIPLIVLAGAALGVIAGAVLQRFGQRGFWLLWVIWMVVCLGPQLLPWKQYTIVDWLFPMIGAAAVAGLVWSVWSLLHAVVKN